MAETKITVKSTGLVRDTDTLWEKAKFKDAFGRVTISPAPTKPEKEEIIVSKGSTEWKKSEIKHKLEVAKRNRDIAARVFANYTLQRSQKQEIIRFNDKMMNWGKKLFGLDAGLMAGCAAGSQLPMTLWGKIGFHVLKFLGGILGVEGESRLSKIVNNETNATINPLTSDQRIDIASGLSKQEVLDCEATMKYWDMKVKKYEKMLEDIEDKELLG